jgi:hypothetical protein
MYVSLKLQPTLSAPLLQHPVYAVAVLFLFLSGYTVPSGFEPQLKLLGYTPDLHIVASAMDQFARLVTPPPAPQIALFNFIPFLSIDNFVSQGVTRAHLPHILRTLRDGLDDDNMKAVFDQELQQLQFRLAESKNSTLFLTIHLNFSIFYSAYVHTEC